MPKLTKDVKQQIRELPRGDLEKVVLKFAARDKEMLGYVYVHFLHPEDGEQDLFDEARGDLELLFEKTFKGRSEPVRQTRLLSACVKRITAFTRIVKNPQLELELLLTVLDYQFSFAPSYLGTYYQAYDNRLARLVQKAIGLVENKLHEDYRLEYKGRIDGYLLTLHRLAPYHPVVRQLPQSV